MYLCRISDSPDKEDELFGLNTLFSGQFDRSFVNSIIQREHLSDIGFSVGNYQLSFEQSSTGFDSNVTGMPEREELEDAYELEEEKMGLGKEERGNRTSVDLKMVTTGNMDSQALSGKPTLASLSRSHLSVQFGEKNQADGGIVAGEDQAETKNGEGSHSHYSSVCNGIEAFLPATPVLPSAFTLAQVEEDEFGFGQLAAELVRKCRPIYSAASHSGPAHLQSISLGSCVLNQMDEEVMTLNHVQRHGSLVRTRSPSITKPHTCCAVNLGKIESIDEHISKSRGDKRVHATRGSEVAAIENIMYEETFSSRTKGNCESKDGRTDMEDDSTHHSRVQEQEHTYASSSDCKPSKRGWRHFSSMVKRCVRFSDGQFRCFLLVHLHLDLWRPF